VDEARRGLLAEDAVNYYNEFDPYAAQWLRNLITAGRIPAGDVDERSIKDVPPSDLAGYAQCHFFAGIGGWSEALRLAGWPAGRPVWTGSCPCQPFSNAGARKGTADDRHLWPYWFELIRQRRPATVFGEQVESAIAHGWLDLVQADVEGEGYAFAAAGIPAAGVGAPHGRHRLWFVADTNGGIRRQRQQAQPSVHSRAGGVESFGVLDASSMDNSVGNGRRAGRNHDAEHDGQQLDAAGRLGGVGDTDDARSQGWGRVLERPRELFVGPTGLAGFWSDCDWLPCTDGKARPVEPGTFPLAHGIQNRVGRLRAYGNAIVPQVAATFIGAYLET
jgi:DNA (cytosine-5)-methyltransferase 1